MNLPGIPGRGKPGGRWHLDSGGKGKMAAGDVKEILQNEKYIGEALLQKTYTVDFLSKKRVKNNGIVPQYYAENSHEPIIPRDLYMQVQEEIVGRANLHSGAKRKKRVYSSKYALSSIVYCSKCGDIYRRIAWNNRGKTFYSLAVLHLCGAWTKEMRCTDHLGIGSARCGGKGNPGSIGRKGCISACFREEYQRDAGE